jgi:hypothetical protein
MAWTMWRLKWSREILAKASHRGAERGGRRDPGANQSESGRTVVDAIERFFKCSEQPSALVDETMRAQVPC